MQAIKRIWALVRGHPPLWIDAPKWTEDDAKALQTYLKSDSGTKLKHYLLNFVLRLQSEAITSSNSLKQKCGYCNGAKATLSQIEILADAERFTAEDAADS